MRIASFFATLASAVTFALSHSLSWGGPTPIRQVAITGAAAPGGGTFSGIDFAGPLSSPSGEIFFNDSNTQQIVGLPGSLSRLNLTAGAVSGLNLAQGETLSSGAGIAILKNPSPGQYLVRVKLTTPTYGGTALVSGSPGAFTKILRTGDVLPGTTAIWSPTRLSPTTFIEQDLPATRSGDPMIKAVTADDSLAYIGLYRNGAWEKTQVIGVSAPGFPAGSNFRLDGVNVRAGNSAGQFIFDALIFNGSTFTGNSGIYIGQNGSLQLMMKSGDVLPGDSRIIRGTFRPGSINNSGTAVVSGFYNGVEGFVYRWSAAGGASKVISHGDRIPSIGPRIAPMINDTGEGRSLRQDS